MNDLLMAVLLSLGAGLTTVLGALFAILFMKKNSEKLVSYILGFTVGIFLIIIFHDLIPESYDKLMELTGDIIPSIALLFLFLVLGYFATYGLDKILPEHDHPKENKLYKTSLTMVLAMTLHKFPEGMIIYMTASNNMMLAVSLAIVIGIHHIPEGISMALTVFKTTDSKRRAMQYSLLSGLAVPLGTLFAYLIFNSFINATLIAIIFSLVSGIMLFVLFNEIIPSLKEQGHLKESLRFTIIGIVIMLLLERFMH